LYNPDIAEAIRSGIVENAKDHYITYGYYEHRMPYEIEVAEDWYLAQYPDVKEAVRKGLFPSGHDHYYMVGFKEGRLPHANFSLRLVE
jgi:3-phytase/alkaline phosphatase D